MDRFSKLSDVQKLVIGIVLAIIGMGFLLSSSKLGAVIGFLVGAPGLGIIIHTLMRGDL